MAWWAVILLIIGACGGVPAFAFLALFGLEMWRERRFTRSLEGRAEMLASLAHHGESVTAALDASGRVPRSEPPHRGFRT